MTGLTAASDFLLPFATIVAAACMCAFGAGVAAGVWLRSRALATRSAAPRTRVVAPEERTLAEPGDQFARVVELAGGDGAFVSDEERIVETIVATLGWSRIRARWFIRINRDRLTA